MPSTLSESGSSCLPSSLQWRHNKRESVSNHRHLDCSLNCLFRRRSKKTSKPRVIGLCEGNSPLTGEFPTQRANNVENVSIWWRLHDILNISFYTMNHCRAPKISYETLYHCWTPILSRTYRSVSVQSSIPPSSEPLSKPSMMASSNGNIFRLPGPLWEESTGFPQYKPVTWRFDVFFDLRLNKRLSKQSRCRWFQTPSCSLWRHSYASTPQSL